MKRKTTSGFIVEVGDTMSVYRIDIIG